MLIVHHSVQSRSGVESLALLDISIPPPMNLPNPPSLQLCESMEVVAGDPPEELASDVRNIKRYVACQRKVFEWVGWYGEVNKNIGEQDE